MSSSFVCYPVLCWALLRVLGCVYAQQENEDVGLKLLQLPRLYRTDFNRTHVLPDNSFYHNPATRSIAIKSEVQESLQNDAMPSGAANGESTEDVRTRLLKKLNRSVRQVKDFRRRSKKYSASDMDRVSRALSAILHLKEALTDLAPRKESRGSKSEQQGASFKDPINVSSTTSKKHVDEDVTERIVHETTTTVLASEEQEKKNLTDSGPDPLIVKSNFDEKSLQDFWDNNYKSLIREVLPSEKRSKKKSEVRKSTSSGEKTVKSAKSSDPVTNDPKSKEGHTSYFLAHPFMVGFFCALDLLLLICLSSLVVYSVIIARRKNSNISPSSKAKDKPKSLPESAKAVPINPKTSRSCSKQSSRLDCMPASSKSSSSPSTEVMSLDYRSSIAEILVGKDERKREGSQKSKESSTYWVVKQPEPASTSSEQLKQSEQLKSKEHKKRTCYINPLMTPSDVSLTNEISKMSEKADRLTRKCYKVQSPVSARK